MTGAAGRVRSLLARGGWLERAPGPGGLYALRLGGDRRSRVLATLDEAAFRALAETPGLRVRSAGGWEGRMPAASRAEPPVEGPGLIAGFRHLIDADGQMRAFRANLGESPVAWLARRRDSDGRPWLSPAEVAAAERLRSDAEMAMSGPSLTMRWDALPRSGGGSSGRLELGDRSLAAGRRVALALNAVDPAHRSLVEQVCIRESALQAAEREAGAPRRQGKLVLKAALGALSRHYGIG